jgi:hypothetical protein
MNETTREIYTYSELRSIADKILNEITKEIDNFYVNAIVEFGKIIVDIGTDFGEISDSVSSRIYDLVQSGEISEEDSYELFDELFRSEIEQINEEYCVYNSGKIETPKYVINFEPLECKGDNCLAGLSVEIELKDKVTDIDVSNIAQLIITVFRL